MAKQKCLCRIEQLTSYFISHKRLWIYVYLIYNIIILDHPHVYNGEQIQ